MITKDFWIFNLSINGTFADGSFGFYNFSQPRVLYAGIEEDVAPPPPPRNVSAPTSLAILGLGLVGLGFVRRNKA